jgi:RNA polymerase sigma-70 factor (ECF subfamily)
MLVDSAHLPAAHVVAPEGAHDGLGDVPPFEQVYETHFAFVWRSVRRLGVSEAALDDVVQEIFLVVHRRLDEFEGRSSLKTWLFGIVLRVVRDHRRSLRRKSPHSIRPEAPVDPDALADARGAGPHEAAANQEAIRVLHGLLDELDDEKREVFVLAELEQMSAAEIAAAVEVNVNTVYSRLRAARQGFEEALARHHARDHWRLR